mgnify:CR=1 FL=1
MLDVTGGVGQCALVHGLCLFLEDVAGVGDDLKLVFVEFIRGRGRAPAAEATIERQEPDNVAAEVRVVLALVWDGLEVTLVEGFDNLVVHAHDELHEELGVFSVFPNGGVGIFSIVRIPNEGEVFGRFHEARGEYGASECGVQPREAVDGAVPAVEFEEVDEEIHFTFGSWAEVGFYRLVLGFLLEFLQVEDGFRGTDISEAEAYLHFLKVAVDGDVGKVGVVAVADGIDG